MTTHHDRSLDHLAAVAVAADHVKKLHDLPAHARHDARHEIAAGYDRIRHGTKLAQVHALLAIAEALSPPDPVASGELNGVRLVVHAVPGIDARSIAETIKTLLGVTPIVVRS